MSLGAQVPPRVSEALGDPTEAIREGIRRYLRTDVKAALTCQDPAAFAHSLDEKYRLRPHLEYLSGRIAAAVRKVEAGQSQYLMVMMPPRSGKSVLASTYAPAWILSQHPEWKIGLISHSPSLASGWGRQVRRLVEEHPSLGVQIAKDAGAVTDWQTTKQGSVISRSIGQSVTGLGFKVLMMDDVVKDFADAHSLNRRNAVWDWWTANSRTRLEPPSLVIAIGTRWHEDDYLGRLRNPEFEGDPNQWEVISFPAIAEEADVLGREIGQPLLSPLIEETPEQALERWADIKSSVGSYAWAALFQQRPAPADGAIFNSNWWQFYQPADLDTSTMTRVITSWDCAFKGTDTSDFVVGQRWGVRGPDRFLLDQIRGRWTFNETLDQMRGFCAGVFENLVEDKANGPAIIDTLKREIPGMIGIDPGRNSKEARARAITPEIESGNVYLPLSTTGGWVSDLLLELQGFPNATHDDQVDALTQALSRLRVGGVGSITVPGRRGAVTRSVTKAVRTIPARKYG